MKLTVLVDNCAGGNFKAEHGLSYLLSYQGKNILLDTGHSDLFMKNAQLLGINLNELVDFVVLSHGHWDHGNGLIHFKDKPLVAHPGVFTKRFRKSDNTPIGINSSKSELGERYDLHLNKTPYLIAEGILFLGEIPRTNDFESQSTPFVTESGEADFVPDDSAIAIVDKGALNVISGCSHAGICNIIEYAKQVMHCNKVNAVVGGFHLKHNNKQTQQTIQYFKYNGITKVYPSHCTSLPALSAFYEVFNVHQLRTGQQIDL